MSKPRRVRPIATRAAVAVSVAGLTALSAQAVASAEEGAVRSADSPNAIAGSYIVVLENGTTSAAAEAQSQIAEYGGEITKTFNDTVVGYAASMSESQAKRVAADDSVAYVEQNQRVQVDQTASWGLDRIDQRDLPLDDAYDAPNDAAGVNVYVIDTGILTTHQDFEGRAEHGYDFVDGDDDATDCQGHGTHVAGTVGGADHGVAKGATLHGVRVLDCNGSGDTAGVIDGVDWVTENAEGPAVANMSLGGGSSQALDDAVTRSIDSGVTYSLASGNGDLFGNPQDACDFSPARVGGDNGPALTVNASDDSDNKGSFSNYGSCTDLYAPGVDITSAWIGSDDATDTISGTSMAAPHVAGAAALHLADNPDATPADVKTALTENASVDKISDVDADTPNRLLYVGSGE